MYTTRLATTVTLGLAALLWGCAAMAAGQAVGIKHPVMDYQLKSSQVEALQASVSPFMAMTEEQACAYVPPHGYTQFTECPNCYGGVEGNGVLTWTFDRPEALTCRFCKTVVLPNEKYPEDRTLTGQNMLGETVTYKYYFNEERKVAHFLSNTLWQHKRAWLIARVTDAARLHALTGKPEYAQRVAVVLDAFAQAYPHYPVMQNGPRRFAFKEQKPHWAWDCGRWNFFHNEIPVEVLPAYDMVYDSPVFDELSQQRGTDVRERIERDFIQAAATGAIARQDAVSNVSGYDIRSAALAGRIINDPPLVHWAYAEMVKHVTEGFFRDGAWKEGTPSYHAMTVGGLKYSFDAVRGYSDPPGYKDPADGTRLDDVQPEADLPLWSRCQTAPELVGLPNGCSSCIHDTHPYERRSEPRDSSVSTILPGMGQASLGRGRQGNQMLAQLHFSGGYGHQHCDNLSLMLWAKEREMLPDIGYTWTQMRYWATSSLGHNLVVVDRRDQNSGPPGNLQLYVPGDVKDPVSPQLAVVEASAEPAYAAAVKGLDLYRRLLVLVPVSADEAYVVDVFRVRGGKTHDWTINGDADRDSTAECSLPLSGNRKWLLEEGEEWKEPTLEGQSHNAYGMVRDVQEGQSQGDLEVRFTGAEDKTRVLKSWIRAGGACQVLLGRSPSVRRMGVGSNADMRKGYDFWMPKLIVRRTGDDPLLSVFAAVHEPYAGAEFIKSVKRLKITPDDGLAVALQVEHAGGTDTIISALPGPAQEYVTDTGVRLTGRLGVVRQAQGKIVGAWLIDGTSLAGPNWEITARDGGYDGEITATAPTGEGGGETAFVTTSALPEGNVLAGRWLIATYTGSINEGYEIKAIRREGDRTLIVLAADPAVRIADGSAEETCFPHRKFAGPVRFHVAGVAALAAQSNGPLQAQVTSPTEFKLPQ